MITTAGLYKLFITKLDDHIIISNSAMYQSVISFNFMTILMAIVCIF